jgi:rhodanese-related sulfurtransferase
LVDTLSKDTPIFVYCYDGDRSKTACKILTRQLNFSRVYNLKKGLEMWKKMDFPVEKTE